MAIGGRAWSFVVLSACLACVQTTRAESEPVAKPLPASIPAAVAATSAEAPPTTPDPANAPKVEVADSQLVERVIVDPKVQPGLIEFSAELGEHPGSLWVGRLEGNGGRDVVIFIPQGADNGAQFEFVYHFHGTYSEHVQRPGEDVPKKLWVGWDRLLQTIEAARELQGLDDQARNVVLIYPFSAGKRLEPGHKGWSNDMYDRMWMSPVQPPDYRDSFDKLHTEVTTILTEQFGAHPSKLGGPIVAEGHSAGGIALRNIADAGTTLVADYLFLDAGFKSWADGCWSALQAAKSTARITMVITDKGIADPMQGRDPWCVELERDSALWLDVETWCETRMDSKPRGSDSTCEELATSAEEWPDYRDWCVEMKTDMASVPGVAVVRTKVAHGDQPRRFAGGLGLPHDRD